MQRYAKTRVVVMHDASNSMDESFRQTTRRMGALEAMLALLAILRNAPFAERIELAQVLFGMWASIHLKPTPVQHVRGDEFGTAEWFMGWSTDIHAGLVKCEAALRLPGVSQQGLAAQSWPQRLTCFLESLDSGSGPSKSFTCDAHILLLTDSERNAGGSDDACVRQAQRLKAAGAHIYAQGIGDPERFGLLPRLVPNPREDFAVHETPESLIRAFRRIAQRFVFKS